MKYTLTLSLSILLLLMTVPTICFSKTSSDRKATITELTATTSETHLIVFGTLVNSFTSEMIEILHSGIPIRFSFFIELFKT
ncbi:MAG: DUF4390 domain-containing protein, partial [Desulforhopalus sp.]